MIVGRLFRALALVAVVSLAVSCGASPVARFYTLDAVATSDGSPAAPSAVAVGPVTVPGAVDRPQFVVQVSPNRVELDEFNRWATPLGDAIARAVAGNLAVLLGTPDVAAGPLANFDAAYRVSIDVQRFDSIQGEGVLLDAVWVVRGSQGSQTRGGRTTARESVQAAGFDALAAAHSQALATLSADIAAAIRSQAGTAR